MLVACRLAGLSALVFDYAVAARVRNPADGVCSPSRLVRDSRTALGSDIGRKPPLEAPDGLKADIAPISHP
jgi:hypothetical protein